MDKKSIAVLAVCFVLLMLWPKLVNQLYPPKPLPPGATNAVATAAATNVAAAPTETISAATNAATAVRVRFDTNAPEQTLTITNANARYVFTSRGGGLKGVDLLHFPETVSTVRKKKSAATGDVITLNDSAPVPVGALLDDGTAQGDGNFQLVKTAAGVRAEKVLANGLTVVKDFALSTNYLVTATVRIENHGAQAVILPARELVIGTATPLGPRDKGQFVGATWFDGAKMSAPANQMWFANRSFLSCVGGTSIPRTEYRGGFSNVVWAAAQNQFFALVAMPQNPAQQVVVRPVPLLRDAEALTTTANTLPPQGFQTALVYPASSLAAGQVAEQKINFFIGPKEYRTLAKIADSFNNDADVIMGYSGFFGGVSRALLLAMNWIHDFIRLPYGWAIITITLLIKVIFWPLTQASTRSMKRMQALQPQMAAIKEKYKDDAVKMNRKTMEFMKEHKVSPLGGCLPMLIQLPIFMGFYRMIQSAIELRGSPFLWIGDLSQPDTLFVISGLGFVPFIGIPGVGLPVNLLPLIMGATQLWQARLTPPSPGMDPAQQKMMRYMPLMFLVILYNFSAGLTLYWTVQNLLTIAQTKLTKTQPTVEIIPPAKKRK